MTQSFQTLESYLHARATNAAIPALPTVAEATVALRVEAAADTGVPAAASAGVGDEATPHNDLAEHLAAELAMVRLASREAFARSCRRLLEALACDVLARELMLGPADIDGICGRALAAFDVEQPVALLVAPRDVEGVRVASVAVRGDPQLQPGDLVVEVRDGTIDARIAVRLAFAVDEAVQ